MDKKPPSIRVIGDTTNGVPTELYRMAALAGLAAGGNSTAALMLDEARRMDEQAARERVMGIQDECAFKPGLHPWQEDVIGRLSKTGTFTVQMDTGAGKTLHQFFDAAYFNQARVNGHWVQLDQAAIEARLSHAPQLVDMNRAKTDANGWSPWEQQADGQWRRIKWETHKMGTWLWGGPSERQARSLALHAAIFGRMDTLPPKKPLETILAGLWAGS